MMSAVIFDLDGLLVDTEIISYQIYLNIISHYGYKMSMGEYAERYSGKTERTNVTNLIKEFKLPISLEDGMELVHEMENKYLSRGVNLKQGAKEAIHYFKLKHFKIALATSSTMDRTFQILGQHNLLEYFDEFTFGNEVSKGKPSPDIFIKTCSKIAERPEDCIIFEDSEAGIQAGADANIPVICIPDVKVPAQHYINRTTAVFGSLSEAIEFIEGSGLIGDKETDCSLGKQSPEER